MDTQSVLRRHDIKITKPRVLIYEILLREQSGVDADYIFRKCEERGVFVNLSTVYRTLDLFEAKGMLDKYDLGEKKYNYSVVRHEHSHQVECKLCHKVLDLDCPMRQIEEMLAREAGFYLTDHHLELKGICKECMELQGERPGHPCTH